MGSGCNGAVKYTESKSLTGGSQSEEVGTTNGPTNPNGYNITTDYPDPAGSTVTYSWQVVYTPPDTAHSGSTSQCETFTTTYTNDPGPS